MPIQPLHFISVHCKLPMYCGVRAAQYGKLMLSTVRTATTMTTMTVTTRRRSIDAKYTHTHFLRITVIIE